MMGLVGDGPIVMVDDDELDIEIVARCLAKSNLRNRFVAFEDAHDFLDYMDRVADGEEEMPAIVLVDINMPRMSGFEVVGRLRLRDEFRDDPFVYFLSNSDSPRDKEMAHEFGAPYHEKSLRTKEYVDFLNNLAA